MHLDLETIAQELWFAARLLVVAAATTGLAWWYRADLRLLPVWAILRAGLQLGVVALLLRGALTTPWAALGFLVLMLTTASWTSSGRIGELWEGRVAALLGVTCGAATSLAAVFALHLSDLQARYVIAIAGIVIGNAMNAATLAGRNFLRTSRARVGEIEAWLALGARPTRAHADIARESVRESLIPNLDQTKATGLVTLPGAFVGALFGGASPLQAAHFQLVVLAGIALAMVVTAMVVASLAARTPYLPVAEGR